MKQFTLIHAEWNSWNGFIFDILDIDCGNWKTERALFGVWFSSSFFYLRLLFFNIKIFDKTDP